jgi:hypothetical protein
MKMLFVVLFSPLILVGICARLLLIPLHAIKSGWDLMDDYLKEFYRRQTVGKI